MGEVFHHKQNNEHQTIKMNFSNQTKETVYCPDKHNPELDSIHLVRTTAQYAQVNSDP